MGGLDGGSPEIPNIIPQSPDRSGFFHEIDSQIFPKSYDGDGAADNDQPYRFDKLPTSERPGLFNARQFAKLLLYRSRYEADKDPSQLKRYSRPKESQHFEPVPLHEEHPYIQIPIQKWVGESMGRHPEYSPRKYDPDSNGSWDGEGATDNDQPHRFGRRTNSSSTWSFKDIEYARLLVLRGGLREGQAGMINIKDDGDYLSIIAQQRNPRPTTEIAQDPTKVEIPPLAEESTLKAGIGTRDGEGAGDHDEYYDLSRPNTKSQGQFSKRQLIRMLLMRGKVADRDPDINLYNRQGETSISLFLQEIHNQEKDKDPNSLPDQDKAA